MAEVKKITADNIAQLYDFTKKHFVEYYDLQTELTDHLANAIEHRWQEEPNLSFNDALKQEFKKFGIFGFMTVVEQRQLALSKRYYKLFWGYFKEFFRLPKIILSALAILLVYKAALMHQVVLPLLLACIILVTLFRLAFMFYKYRQKVKKTGKRWMFEDIIYKGGGIGLAFLVPYQPISHLINIDHTIPLVIGILSVWTVLFALYEYIILFVIPSKAQEHLNVTYPEYSLQS